MLVNSALEEEGKRLYGKEKSKKESSEESC
jgi:hypothetical protein